MDQATSDTITQPEGRRLLSAALTMAHRWKGRIFFAIVDQGCASAANFLLTILYAAWLPLDEFGRYVIVWTVSILVESFQISLIMDSMPSIVSRYGQRNRQRIDGAGSWVVLIYGAVTSVLILAAIPAVTWWTSAYTVPLICLAAVNPFQRLYIFFRRLCYIRDRQDAAAVASMAYGVTLVGGALALFALGLLSVAAVVLLWGLANGVAILVIYATGITCLRWTRLATVAWLIVQLWRSGRWLAGAAVGFWIANWGMFPLVAAMAGAEAAGILRALQNLFTPIVQFNAALNLAILPRVADKIVLVGQHYARSFAIYGTAAFTGIVVLYAAVVLSASDTILSLMYRKPEIIASAHLLWPLAVAMTVEAGRQASSMGLLAAGRTRVFFMSRLAAIGFFLSGAIVLGRIMGIEGILWANVIAHTVGAIMLIAEVFGVHGALDNSGRSLGVGRTPKHEPVRTSSA